MINNSGSFLFKNLTALRKFVSSSRSFSKVLINKLSPSTVEFRLNNPSKLNSLDSDMCDILADQLLKWKADQSHPQILIMSGEGPKAFCAGGDVVTIYRSIRDNGPLVEKTRFFRKQYNVDYALYELKDTKTKYIALWDGIVMGGGVGLTINADYRIATEISMFAMPQTTIGFFCDVGGSFFLSRIHNNPAYGLYLGLTSQKIKGKELLEYGLATHFIDREKINAFKDELKVTSTEQNQQEVVKKLIDKYCTKSESKPANSELIEKWFDMKDTTQCQDIVKRVQAAAAESNEFAQKILKQFKRMSPLAMKLVYQQIKRGQNIGYKECLQMEFNMGMSAVDKSISDFGQGVRALLVDKDNKPKWKYSNLEEVDDKVVQMFFQEKAEMTLKLDILKYKDIQ